MLRLMLGAGCGILQRQLVLIDCIGIALPGCCRLSVQREMKMGDTGPTGIVDFGFDIFDLALLYRGYCFSIINPQSQI